MMKQPFVILVSRLFLTTQSYRKTQAHIHSLLTALYDTKKSKDISTRQEAEQIISYGNKALPFWRLQNVIIVFIFIGCKGLTNKPASYWETQKANFRYQNKKEFVSDSLLWADFQANSFKKLKHPMFDSIIGAPGYLYSWQDRDTTKNEFTIINDDGELGLKIFYFILDRKDSLLSWAQIAGKGSEGGYWFETKSKFISQDSLLNIGAITQWLDFDNNQQLTSTKGDSTFSFFIFDKTGKVTEKVFKEVLELNFDKDQ